MSGLLTQAELDGIRADAKLLMGIRADGTDSGKTQITIERPDLDGSFDEETGLYSLDHTELYAGAAIVFPVVFRRSRQERVVEEDSRVRVYRVLVPFDAADIYLEDIVTITACSDSYFVGRVLRVIDVMYESEQGLRRIDTVDVEDDAEVIYPT